MAGLENVESAAHVAFAEGHERIDGVGGDVHLFLRDYLVDEGADGGFGEGGEAEASAAGEEGGGELVGVVCDDAEASVGGIFFHYAAEGHLRGGGHGVGFVKDDEFVGCEG